MAEGVSEPGATAVTAGSSLGKYQLVKRLSVGGMAEIFLARVVGLPGFQKLVVVKRILPQLAGDPQFVNMFLDEARIAATLQHPHIVQTYDVCVADGNYFIAMEYLHGEDVRSILRAAFKQGRRLAPEHVLQIMIALSAGLHYAHEREDFDGKPLSIVHCDVSPGNVIVTYEGGVKLVDFGIARAANRAHETRSGTLKGKIGYMSPEQARAEKLDRRTDVFAAGVILYELSLGRRLYRGTSDYEVLHQIVQGKITPPRKIDPEYDPELERIVMRALTYDRDKRYQTAHDLQMALEDLARERRLYLSTTGLKQLMGELFGQKLDAWREAQREGKSLAEHLELVAGYEEEDETAAGEPLSAVPRRRRWLVPAVVMAAAALAWVAILIAWHPAHVAARAGASARATPTLPPANPSVAAASAPEPTAPAENEPATGATTTSAPTARTGTGSIKVVTHPHGAMVSIDGSPPQRSPALFDGLADGQPHVVVAQLLGYREARRQLTVAARQKTTVTLALLRARDGGAHATASAAPAPPSAPPAAPPATAPAADAAAAHGEGTLAIATNPWCTVTVDGVDRGQTPVNLKLSAGRHTVTLSNPEFHVRRQIAVMVKANEAVRKKLDFTE
jgi:hypothetical protein